MSHNPSTAAPNRFPVSIIPTPHSFGNKSNGRVAYNKCGRPMDKMRYSRGCRTWSFGVTGKPTSIRWTRIDLELSYAQVFCIGGDSVLEVDAEIATSTPNETRGGIPVDVNFGWDAGAAPADSVTPIILCTPPPCKQNETYACPSNCPGGCGTQCATRTPMPSVLPSTKCQTDVRLPQMG